jgi:hypothetical protein
MRRFPGLLAAAVVAGAVAAAPAMAQDMPDTDFSLNVNVKPKNAGTKKNPQGITLSGNGKWNTEAGFDPPIITGADILIGKGGQYNGGKYAKCTKKILDREGPKGCPKKSIMGKATGVARADTVNTKPDVVFVNGGAKKMFFYTTLYHPTLVQEPIEAKITKMTGKWRYRTRLTVPENLQVVAGVPIQLISFKFKVGGKPYAKEYFATTSCPKGGWKYQVTTFYLYDLLGQTSEDTYAGSESCKK